MLCGIAARGDCKGGVTVALVTGITELRNFFCGCPEKALEKNPLESSLKMKTANPNPGKYLAQIIGNAVTY
jgi:hypothetical protein